MTVAERIVDHLHPALAALRDDPTGEAAFWARVAEDRAPLIEPDPARPGYRLVTYVFPRPAGAGHVVMQAGFGGGPAHVMARLEGTSVCHATYRYRNDVRTSYGFWPDLPVVAWDTPDAADFKRLLDFMRGSMVLPDPHHREHFVSRAGEGLPDLITSVLSLPDACDAAHAHKRTGIQRGRIEQHVFESQLLGNSRSVWVYTPPGYAAEGKAYPVLIAFDGGMALSQIPVHRLLDNLLADGAVAPAVAVFIDNATAETRNTELPCSESFARFFEEELLPWLRSRWRLSRDPKDHFVTGASYGGLAAMWFGYRLPHIFGNVISQAASLWWGPGYQMGLPIAGQAMTPEWLTEQYRASERLPVRFWMEIGLMEPFDRMIEPNRRMRSVLEEKGYNVTYSEPAGGHDPALWRGTLTQALTTMLPNNG